jgi:hypothetical protein
MDETARGETTVSERIVDVWDDPASGLTAADFGRWPAPSGDARIDPDEFAPLLQGALNNGDISLPVYLVGRCSTFPEASGHTPFAARIIDFVPFVVSAHPETGEPRVTTITKKPIREIVESTSLPAFDSVEREECATKATGGYVDLQMSNAGEPTARIGFVWNAEVSKEDAYARANAVLAAIERCRSGTQLGDDKALPPGECSTRSAPSSNQAT